MVSENSKTLHHEQTKQGSGKINYYRFSNLYNDRNNYIGHNLGNTMKVKDTINGFLRWYYERCNAERAITEKEYKNILLKHYTN